MSMATEQLQFEGLEHGEVDGDVLPPPPPAPETGYDIPPTNPETTTDPREECITAFIVYITAEGKAIAHPHIGEILATKTFRREATFEDMRRAAHEIVDDVDTILLTNNILQQQMQVARELQAQVEAQRIAAQTGGMGGVDLGRLRQQ